MKKFSLYFSVLALIMASLACGRLTKKISAGTGGAPGTASPGSSGSSGYNTKFPLPDSVINFTDTGNGSINFQTKMSVTDTIAWYRAEFVKTGLRERTSNTAITASTFSMVFDGDPSGLAIVIQGVDLGNGLTNVNIRYEKV
jgi:hypothetical protein